MACIYRELLSQGSHYQFNLRLNGGGDGDQTLQDPVTICLRGCQGMFPESFFAGIRTDGYSGVVECHCLKSDAFNASTIGPLAKCDQVSRR
jgi:hypothetical protein